MFYVISGVFGVPLLDVAFALKEAINIYDESLSEVDHPTHIHLVNILPDTTQMIIGAFRYV